MTQRISRAHLPRPTASSLFKLRAWQSLCRNSPWSNTCGAGGDCPMDLSSMITP